jgi:hypothetical protein
VIVAIAAFLAFRWRSLCPLGSRPIFRLRLSDFRFARGNEAVSLRGPKGRSNLVPSTQLYRHTPRGIAAVPLVPAKVRTRIEIAWLRSQ